jgi:hypothetical protein
MVRLAGGKESGMKENCENRWINLDTKLIQIHSSISAIFFPPTFFSSKQTDPKITCYGCKKLGHYKSECPLNKQKKSTFIKKSMFATWDCAEGS